jgi:hypothetical protein
MQRLHDMPALFVMVWGRQLNCLRFARCHVQFLIK